MATPGVDTRSPARRALYDQIANEPQMAPLDLPNDAAANTPSRRGVFVSFVFLGLGGANCATRRCGPIRIRVLGPRGR
jgi:hypothetical protein